MADFLRIAGTLINLDRVEAIRLDQARPPGKPGRCHKIFFAVGATMYEDRELSLHEGSDEGIALRRWADGLDGEPEVVSIPVVPPHDPDKVVIQPLRAASELVAIANGFRPPVVAVACIEGPEIGRGA